MNDEFSDIETSRPRTPGGGVISPTDARLDVSLAVDVSPAWPAKPVDVAQPATRRMQVRALLVPAACSRVKRAA